MVTELFAIEEIVPPKPNEPMSIFLVVAWNCNDKYWRIHRDTRLQEFTSIEAARAYAERLSAVWSNAKIFHLRNEI